MTESHIVPRQETTFFGLYCSAGNSSRHDCKLLVNFEHGILAVLYTCTTCLTSLGSSSLSLVKARVSSRYAFFSMVLLALSNSVPRYLKLETP